ncbi:MAG: hypothetical protein HC933_00785 [Pleurocapsa sp. SU_196_0]|nr:hypothetical protein [Pleurocapsa sp. SU_196_0]
MPEPLPFFPDETTPPSTNQERANAFLEQYPEVYELFKFYALELLRAGRSRYSARTIVERVRWHQATSSQAEGGYKGQQQSHRLVCAALGAGRFEVQGLLRSA